MLSFSFHWALQFECLTHQSILLWLHFTWFHDICIIWSFCTTTLSHKIDRISKLLAENQQIPWNTRPLLRVNAMFQFTKIGYLNINYVHISNCHYVLSWQFLCEMFACLQTHIKNRLFVRQYQVQCIIYWFFFSSLPCTFKSVFHGISNLIFSFMFTYLFVHIDSLLSVSPRFIYLFFLVCIVVASVVVFVIFPLILMVSWSVHLMVSWHKFTCLYTKVWAYFCFACLLVFLLVRCISVVFASKHYAHHSIR